MGKYENPTMMYLKKLAKVLVIIGALNWGSIGLTGVDLVKTTLPTERLQRAVYVLVGLAGLVVAYMMYQWLTNYDTGAKKWKLLSSETLIPTRFISGGELEGEEIKEMEIKTSPNKQIIYWAALEDEDEDPSSVVDYTKAYGDGSNSGITRSDSNGAAKIKYLVPQGYTVPGKTLKPHIHYRVIEGPINIGPTITLDL